MKLSIHPAPLCALSLFLPWLSLQGDAPKAPTRARPTIERPPNDIASCVVKTANGGSCLVEELWIDAPVKAVWKAYSTAEGWRAWAAPVAEVEPVIGGKIRTNYKKGSKIGDPGTNTLHVLAVVPERLLTLRAETQERWPEVMKKDASKMSNVIVFDSFGPKLTRIRSYGCGYRKSPEYKRLLGFFATANRGLYGKLKAYLEKGKRAFD